MPRIRFLLVLAAVIFASSAVAHAGAGKVSDLFAPLWNGLATSSDPVQTFADPVLSLVRLNDRVRATVVGDFDHTAPLAAGVTIIAQRDGWAEVWTTRAGLDALDRDPRIHAVYPPEKLRPLERISEARIRMNWAPYNAAGVGGRGVRVAVIDVGFAGYESLKGVELPANVFFKSFILPANQRYYASEAHGAAVAEIVHDIAPEADIFLLAIETTSDLLEAVQWCIDHDIAVVNMSLGFFGGPRDGTGVAAGAVDQAMRAGIIWANATGNAAEVHWGGTATDADGDSFIEFAPDVEVIGFNWSGPDPLLSSVLIWDRWPTTDGLSLDLEIYSDSNRSVLLATSSGGPALNLAFRYVLLDNPLINHRYYLAVRRSLGTLPTGLRIDIYNDDYAITMQPQTPEGSLMIPSDARGVVAVGAYDYAVVAPGADPVRPYSSRGPTWDGRIKPELVAGDGVSTETYGFKNFYGTSASTPHIAGAAALLSSATVSGGLFTYVWSVDDFLRLMAVNSIDFGAIGTDGVYGIGGAVLPPASDNPDSFAVARAYPNPSNAGVNISFAARPGTAFAVRIYNVLGRLVWETEGLQVRRGEMKVHWPGTTLDGHDAGSGVYFYRVDTDTHTLRGKAVILK